jgi:hypothetical protein
MDDQHVGSVVTHVDEFVFDPRGDEGRVESATDLLAVVEHDWDRSTAGGAGLLNIPSALDGLMPKGDA